MSIQHACAVGFFHHEGVLTLDNASIHNRGNTSVLEDWLLEVSGVLVLFLPPWSPNLNPIELVWNTMVKHLKNIPIIHVQ